MNNYQIARTKIQTGDVYGTFSTALFSRIIRLFTKSKTSHVWLFIWLKNRLFCVEMMEWKGVVLVPASNRLQEDFYWGRMHHDCEQEDIIEDCLDEVGRRKYSMIWAILAPFINTKRSNNICSEFVADILREEFEQLNRWILPIDIMNKCHTVTLVQWKKK